MGDATVIATWFSGADTLADTVIVTFTPGTPTFVRVVATPETLYANDTLTAHVAITVTDFFGNMFCRAVL
jgi:hypothetical protein